MGMPEQPQSGMNIAPDGTVYEILDDGTIKRIGKVSPDGSFEPFGGTKDGIREKDGIIYRVVKGKEVKIGRILPNGEIETINQRIKSEAEVARSKVKIVTIVSVCCLIALIAILHSFNSQRQAKVKTAEIDARIRREELASQERRAEEERKRKEAETRKAEEARKAELNLKQEAALEQYFGGEKQMTKNKIWSEASSEAMNWSRAKKYCEALSEGGHADWRLPKIDELRSTIKNCSKSENEKACQFWSSSRSDDFPDGACYMGFSHGYLVCSKSTNTYYVRCVRDAK